MKTFFTGSLIDNYRYPTTLDTRTLNKIFFYVIDINFYD